MHDVKSKEDHHHRWFSFCFYRHTPSRLKAISYSSHRTTAKAHRHFPIITPKSETQPQQAFQAISATSCRSYLPGSLTCFIDRYGARNHRQLEVKSLDRKPQDAI